MNDSMRRRSFCLVLPLCLLALASGRLLATGLTRPDSGPLRNLRDTGLYSDFASKTVGPEILSYSPQYPLWSDGAIKHRWIYLPPGTSIDATDPDVWAFPAGTKVWKEFSFGGHRVETRLIELSADGKWRFASYAWNADESDAVLVPVEGLKGVAEIQPGLRHDIPSVLDCQACHVNHRTELLGFSALQLSPDRDANAPHAEPATPRMVNLKTLIKRKLIRSYPAEWKRHPLRIVSVSPTARAALGYLHANCGNCHNPQGSLDTLNLLLRHLVTGKGSIEPAIATAVNKRGRFRIPGLAAGETFLILPGNPEHSAVLFRMSSRNPIRQMPPLGTKLADAEAINLVRRWIEVDLARDGHLKKRMNSLSSY